MKIVFENEQITERLNQSRSALHLAAKKGNDVIVKLLLENGAQINAANEFGKTALHRAIEYGKQSIVFIIHPTNQIKSEFLYIQDQEQMVDLLLEKGAFVNARDYYGRSGLYMAARNGNKNIVQLLITKGISELCLHQLDELIVDCERWPL